MSKGTIKIQFSPTHPAPQKRERNQILVQLVDQGIHRDKVADILGISSPYVCMIYKAETGMTITEAHQ